MKPEVVRRIEMNHQARGRFTIGHATGRAPA